ncbi:MAG: N-acetylmuramoyl-L-alanine amidase [Lapillicoccus sp.]
MTDQAYQLSRRPGQSPPALHRRSRGPAVRALREQLAAAGDLEPLLSSTTPGGDLASDEVFDDVFDDDLDRAVRAFQQRRGLIVDGLVGPQTGGALEGARWHLGDRLLQFTPGHLVRGDDVSELQERLLTLGFTPGRVDGMFGPDTDHAVRAFQRGCGLPVDGSVGPGTLRAFDGLRRSVSGGAPHSLREREGVRRSGHSLAGRTIVIDPGHGGDDLGAQAHGLVEAEVVLDLARRIEGRLSAHGVAVVLTRGQHTAGGDDTDRAHFANDCGADLVLSLHCDHAEHDGASGVATFFYGQDRFGAWSAIGEQLADLIQREAVARTGLVDCRSHARSWALLQHTKMPTVVIEAGYLTHPADAARLAEPSFRDDIAEAVVVAVQRMYLGDEDMGGTGLLHLGDLRRFMESLAG